MTNPGSRNVPKRGDIWDAFLDPAIGHEQGGRRPVVVISNDTFNSSESEMCMIVPLTTRDRGIWAHPQLPTTEGGVTQPSFILCDQIRTISQIRLKRYRGRVSAETMAQVIMVVGLMLETGVE